MKNTILLLLLFSFAACEKGEQGESGKDGNANVTSYLLTILPSDWEYIDGIAHVDIIMPGITSEIINSGTVSAFIKADETYLPLPLTVSITSEEKQFQYSFAISEGNIGFNIKFSDGSPIGTVGGFTYKVVIISGQ